MPKSKTLTQEIQETEFTLAKYKAISQAYPDAKIQRNAAGDTHFSSKTVNQNYSNLKFDTIYNTLRVVPTVEFEFVYDGKTTIIPIYSTPKYNRLAYCHFDWKTRIRTIKFSRLAINLKNNNFKEDMLNDCRVHIMNFVKSHSDFKLDEKHLDPKIKKLLLFT